MLDANALIGFLGGQPGLNAAIRAIISDPGPGNQLAIPTIALVEAWDLARKKRRGFDDFSLVARALRSRGILVQDLNLPVIRHLQDLWQDSRDMIILATALDLEARHGQGTVTLITKDRKLRNDQTLIPCLW